MSEVRKTKPPKTESLIDSPHPKLMPRQTDRQTDRHSDTSPGSLVLKLSITQHSAKAPTWKKFSLITLDFGRKAGPLNISCFTISCYSKRPIRTSINCFYFHILNR